MYENWVFSASQGKLSGAVFLDLSATFDLVPTDILMKKLEIYGLQGSFLNWIRGYLDGRYQAVWIDHCFSNYLPCDVGVLQGSILGPLIFLLFINDLSYEVSSDLQQYADDTTISESSDDVDTLSLKLTENCVMVSLWMSQNQFKLNPDKTHVLLLGTQRRLQLTEESLSVYMDGIELRESDTHCETILGCVIQKNLKWTNQIERLKGSLKKRLAGVYNLRGALPYQTLKTISEGWFQSVLLYCLPLFGGCDKGEIQDLQIIQNKVARLVTGSNLRRNRCDIFEQLKWFTVNQLIIYQTLLTVFRIKKYW